MPRPPEYLPGGAEQLVREPVTPDPPSLESRVVLRQQWNELASFHWSYEPQVVQRLLPAGVDVDSFGGRAWVGLIPFEMERVRLGASPVVPILGNFIEINVRTYVLDEQGRRAVWFFSLDVPRAAIVAVARSVFSLPYCWGPASHERTGDRHRYRTRRRWPHRGVAADIAFAVGERIPDDDVSDLDHFLSARWALLTRRGSDLRRGPVAHPRWPLHRVNDIAIDEDLIEAAGLPRPTGQPHALYSPGVDVEIAWFEPVLPS